MQAILLVFYTNSSDPLELAKPDWQECQQCTSDANTGRKRIEARLGGLLKQVTTSPKSAPQESSNMYRLREDNKHKRSNHNSSRWELNRNH